MRQILQRPVHNFPRRKVNFGRRRPIDIMTRYVFRHGDGCRILGKEVDRMNQIHIGYPSASELRTALPERQEKQKKETAAAVSFENILAEKVGQRDRDVLKFSKHAAERLEERNINLSREQSERLSSGLSKAGEKGIENSLVLMDSLAFIINVPRSTVVTAMDERESREKTFTNIDGAVIV